MISAIVAVDEDWGIGYQGELLEKIPDDLKAFQGITKNGTVIMGRKTWDSLPIKPLPNRANIIITHNPIYRKGLNVGNFTMDTFKKLLPHLNGKVFIIGGASIYKELLRYCNHVFLTRIYKKHDKVDAYFPELNPDEWRCIYQGEKREYNNISYQFFTYERV